MRGTMTSFDKLHKETVTDFLSGVVIIDDQIEYCKSCEPLDTEQKKAVDPNDNLFGGATAPITKDTPSSTKPDKNVIFSPDMVNAFANAGISCVTYKWSGDPASAQLPKLCEKVDVVVFDWELDNVNNYTALPLIKTLIDQKENEFQYIVIYTSQSSHEEMLDEIVAVIGEPASKQVDGEEGKVYLDYDFENNLGASFRIEIIEKCENDAELCNKLIDGFAHFSQGFLRRVTLSAITALRKNTFKIISLYPPEIDKAFISHYTSLLSSEKMFPISDLGFHDYTVSILSNALHDCLIYSETLKSSINKDSILSHLEKNIDILIDNQRFRPYLAKDVVAKKVLDPSDHAKLASELYGVHEPANHTKSADIKNSFKKDLKAFYLESDDKMFHLFSSLDCINYRHKFCTSNCHPLKFGTVIEQKELQSGKIRYFLCLQPLCDSIRLRELTTFPFVELTKDKKSPCYVLINNDNSILNLRPRNNPHQHLHSFKFEPSASTSDVRCNENFIIQQGDTSYEYKWLAELRLHHTQELAHSIANQGTKIGADKFEWLRINSKST